MNQDIQLRIISDKSRYQTNESKYETDEFRFKTDESKYEMDESRFKWMNQDLEWKNRHRDERSWKTLVDSFNQIKKGIPIMTDEFCRIRKTCSTFFFFS